ncbi:MAG: hypothetical protein ACXWKY_14615 [Caulobacteraceae bacterium]
MAFDDPAPPSDPRRVLSIVPCRDGWAIMHGNGFLGLAADQDEAARLLKTLQDEGASEVSRLRR